MNLLGWVVLLIFSSIIIGYLNSDNKKWLSKSELKVSAVIGFIITAYIGMNSEESGLYLVVGGILSWVVFIVGMIAGEIIRLKIHGKQLCSEDEEKVSLKIAEKIGKVNNRS